MTLFDKKFFNSLKTGIAVFEAEELIEINDAAKILLKIENKSNLGPYSNSLLELLKFDEDNYSKQLTGVLGKPLTAILHINEKFKIIEISESFETKLGEASHELRRPMTNVKTLVDTLHLWGAGEDPDARKKFLGQLHTEVNRLTKLVEELLDLSRIQAGSIPLTFQQVALRPLVQESFNLLKEQAAKNQIQLINEIPDNFILVADLDKFSHVVENLIENAIRYNRSAGKVTLRRSKEDKNTLEIEDTGLGIAQDNIPYIFERFKRFNKEIPGTGLGLAIVKAIVDLHGGKISVSSEVGKGTKFSIFIPRRKIVLPVTS